MKINKSTLHILETILLCQILMEKLDDIKDNSFHDLKLRTNNYLSFLEDKMQPIILNTFKSNPDLFENILNDIRNNKSIEKYFEII